jgi:hypothetical protein
MLFSIRFRKYYYSEHDHYYTKFNHFEFYLCLIASHITNWNFIQNFNFRLDLIIQIFLSYFCSINSCSIEGKLSLIVNFLFGLIVLFLKIKHLYFSVY